MNFIDKIIEKLKVSFVWKGNQKKVIKQTGTGLQVHQEQNGITNVFQIENVNVAAINELIASDPSQDTVGLMRAAGKRFLVEQAIKQENLKAIVSEANLSTILNPQQVEKDWFLKWMEISQNVSREDVQKMLAKILSGEVNNSGSFSLRSLDVLKNLSKTEFSVFQIFCDISFSIPQFGNALTFVIVEPYGSPGNNGMLSLGLSYANLSVLQDAGLIQSELNAWKEFLVPDMLEIPFALGATLSRLQATAETTEVRPHVKIINFTSAGIELRSVLKIGTNSEYNSKFLEWANSQWKMIPAALGRTEVVDL